jgi:hypothetical protein
MSVQSFDRSGESMTQIVEAPAPTAWPIALALGITLLFAGLVTSAAVSALGAVITIAAAAGWFRNVLPQEAHEALQAATPVPGGAPMPVMARGETAARVPRAWLPVEVHPISAGVKGGLAGSVVMALLAMTYGILSQGSVWYPINLLAAGFLPAATTATTAEAAAFHLSALLIAIPIHLGTSLLVGLLYGATLPMLSRRPVLLGGVIAPIFWSGVIHSILGIVNPVLNHRIDWVWFVASQVGFGIVAGVVVSRQERIPTGQHLSLARRMGMETSGHDRPGEDQPR